MLLLVSSGLTQGVLCSIFPSSKFVPLLFSKVGGDALDGDSSCFLRVRLFESMPGGSVEVMCRTTPRIGILSG